MIVVEDFPSNLVVLGCIAVALAAAWYGLLRRGAARLLGLILALVALAAAVVILIVNGDHIAEAVLIVAGVAAAIAVGEGSLPAAGGSALGAGARSSGAALQPEVGRRQGGALLPGG